MNNSLFFGLISWGGGIEGVTLNSHDITEMGCCSDFWIYIHHTFSGFCPSKGAASLRNIFTRQFPGGRDVPAVKPSETSRVEKVKVIGVIP